MSPRTTWYEPRAWLCTPSPFMCRRKPGPPILTARPRNEKGRPPLVRTMATAVCCWKRAELGYHDVTAFRLAAAHSERFRWLDEAARRPVLRVLAGPVPLRNRTRTAWEGVNDKTLPAHRYRAGGDAAPPGGIGPPGGEPAQRPESGASARPPYQLCHIPLCWPC